MKLNGILLLQILLCFFPIFSMDKSDTLESRYLCRTCRECQCKSEKCVHTEEVHSFFSNNFYEGSPLPAFYEAIDKNNARLVRLFLDKGISIESVNHVSETPLFRATDRKCYDVTKLLLQRGANPNANNGHNSYFTPLHNAADNNDYKTAKLLLDYGANPRALDYRGRTPRDMAIERGHTEITNLLTFK